MPIKPVKKSRKKADVQLHYVAVTTILPWIGDNPEHAANNAAASLGHSQEHTADFYGPSVMVWGPVDDVVSLPE